MILPCVVIRLATFAEIETELLFQLRPSGVVLGVELSATRETEIVVLVPAVFLVTALRDTSTPVFGLSRYITRELPYPSTFSRTVVQSRGLPPSS